MRRAAAVEARHAVGRQQDGSHGGGTSPEPRAPARTARSRGSAARRRRRCARRPAGRRCAPSAAASNRTTVTGTGSSSASSKSSKPTSATGAPRAIARSAPTVLRLSAQNSAVGRRSGGRREQRARRALRVAVGHGDERVVERDARVARAPRGSRRGGARRCRARATRRRSRCAGGRGRSGARRAARAPPTLSSRTVSASIPPGGRSMKTIGVPRVLLAEQVAVVVAGRDDQQRVDPAAQQPQHERALARRVLLAGPDQQRVAAVVRLLLDRAGDRGVERVREVLDHQADRARPAVAQAVARARCGGSRAARSRPRRARPSRAGRRARR